jgi:protein-S-isoprenylcysteine O-methyltransferase Ste14
MSKIIIFIYGVLSYALFFATFLYSIGFIGDFFVPITMDSGAKLPLAQALAIDFALLGLFAVQHSGMARPAFKRWLTKYVPEPAERSTYVLLSSLCLIVLYWFWKPLGGSVWAVDSQLGATVLYTLFGLGWLTVLIATFLINHFDLFGLRQVWLNLRGKPYTQLPFRVPGPYRLVRHPLYVGWLMVIWFTPSMTAAHLFFALVVTAYILVAIQFEERDLVKLLPGYADYKKRVPMLLPLGSKSPAGAQAGALQRGA